MTPSAVVAAPGAPASEAGRWIVPPRQDPRWVFSVFLGLYVVAGHWFLSFNRAPLEIVVAIVACCGLDMLYTFVATRRLIVPLSGLISAFGLAILFTAPGSLWLMLLVSWMTITGKYVVTWRGAHLFNPTNLALVLILVGSQGAAAVAPAYQWGGHIWVTVVVFALGLVMMRKVRKLPLVLSFWAVYALGALLRARLSHMPAEITLFATVTGGAFMLFSFFMITDPKTSPSRPLAQIAFGAGLAAIDFWFQLSTAIFSLFYALFAVCLVQGLIRIGRDVVKTRREAKDLHANVNGEADESALPLGQPS